MVPGFFLPTGTQVRPIFAPAILAFTTSMWLGRDWFLLLGNCSCVALLHAILGIMQNLHTSHPCTLGVSMDAGGRATHGAVAEALKQVHSKLCNFFSNVAIGTK